MPAIPHKRALRAALFARPVLGVPLAFAVDGMRSVATAWRHPLASPSARQRRVRDPQARSGRSERRAAGDDERRDVVGALPRKSRR